MNLLSSKNSVLSLAFLVLALAAPAWAAKDLGDPAPPLEIGTWVKGGPVTLSAGKGKNIYVIEFWATWCPPCRASIPHLSELQSKFKDKGVVLIGVTDEAEPVVKTFVSQQGDKMAYTVGIDKEQATGRAYMEAFGIDSIPYAFLVDKNGVIAWHGHPDAGLDEAVEQMVAGKFDIEIAKQTAAAVKLMDEYFSLLDKAGEAEDAAARQSMTRDARQIGESLLQKGARNSDVLNEFAWNLIMIPGIKSRDLDLAARASEAALKSAEQTPQAKSRKLMMDYFRMAQSVTETQPANDKTRQQLTTVGDAFIKQADTPALNDFAWTILTAPELAERDVNLALRVAENMHRTTGGNDPSVLDTYALALFKTGKRDQAVELTKKAIGLSKDEQMTEHLQEMIKEYQQ